MTLRPNLHGYSRLSDPGTSEDLATLAPGER